MTVVVDSEYLKDIEATFRENIKDHVLIVPSMNGVIRHLQCNGSSASGHNFTIMTWPDHLAISGDMGTYVFSRTFDMFELFRGDKVNPSYWMRKLEAVDRHCGLGQFSQRLYQRALKEDFNRWEFADEATKKKSWDAIVNTIFMPANVEEALSLTSEWKCPYTGQSFDSFWEHTLEEATFHFLWCCFAINWAVNKFDELTKN